ncbi:TylF/MycF/NovP-related O-methyltransferase [Kiloniella antarctica]|uniref:TylF/MycF/NovP-related O-methyltransferase n=1 Tax=Kiloniella antarctica TaxID=1550907 RepID=A0ABW5BKR6_9PROT
MDDNKLYEDFMLVSVNTDRLGHIIDGASLADTTGYFLEFGVYKGRTLNHIAGKFPSLKIWGFDSFDGLPEPWVRSYDKTNVTPQKWFALDELPVVASNVELVVGLYESSLPAWLSEHDGNVSFLHVDCDLYSSTKEILNNLNDRIVPGTIIVFDELFDWPEAGYESWRECEWKALIEWMAEYGRDVEPLCRTDTGQASLTVIK